MAEFPLTRRQALILVAVALVALVVASRVLRRPPPAAVRPPIVPTSTVARPPSALVVVDIVGAVRRPGLYRLREGSRIADALARAGGAARKADLAAPLADGEQVVVPRHGGAGVPSPGGAAPPTSSGPVHLNTATLEQLDAL